jgi:high-affinity Fe2+/Pb2+ permease
MQLARHRAGAADCTACNRPHGKGVSARQEAGWVPVTAARVPHAELLGVYLPWQTSLAQLVVLLVLVSGFAINSLRSRSGAVTVGRS